MKAYLEAITIKDSKGFRMVFYIIIKSGRYLCINLDEKSISKELEEQESEIVDRIVKTQQYEKRYRKNLDIKILYRDNVYFYKLYPKNDE